MEQIFLLLTELVEFSESSLVHGGIISPIHARNMVALDVCHRMRGQVPREGDGEIIAQRAQFTTLIREIVDELAVLAILKSTRF